jgi:hypothetical protein
MPRKYPASFIRQTLLCALKHGLLLCVALVLTLIGLELSLRSLNFPYQPNEKLYSDDKLLARNEAWGHANAHGKYIPHSKHSLISKEFSVEYIIDEHGYLGYAETSDISKQPLVALGDSFTFGYGVDSDKSFATLLGAYNAGLWGVSYPGHAKAYRQIADKINHSKVIWTIYPPHLITLGASGWQSSNFWPVKSGGMLERFIKVWNATKLSALLVYTTGYGINTYDYYNKEYVLYSKDAATSLNDTLDMLTKAGEEILDVCHLNNAAPQAVIIPSKTQIYLEAGTQPVFPVRKNAYQLDASIATELVKEALLKAGFHSNEIIVFDWQAVEDISSQFFHYDAHWNATGHRKYAEFLANLP